MLRVLLLVSLVLPLIAQEKVAPTRLAPEQGSALALKRELLLNDEAFAKSALDFVAAWEAWVAVQNRILSSPTFDVALLKQEAKLWKDVVAKMRQLKAKREELK